MIECREKARIVMQQGKPTNWIAASVVIAIWLVLSTLAIVLITRIIKDLV
jgi:hypothetical protein